MLLEIKFNIGYVEVTLPAIGASQIGIPAGLVAISAVVVVMLSLGERVKGSVAVVETKAKIAPDADGCMAARTESDWDMAGIDDSATGGNN
jgi:hypothetical protein